MNEQEHTFQPAEQKQPKEFKPSENLSLDVFGTGADFETASRMAGALAKSTIVPKDYQNNPSNCLIALEMASRIKLSPMMVMQNLHIITGKPTWSSQMIVTLINSSRRFAEPLRFEMTGSGETLACYAWTTTQTGEKVKGVTITMQMAKDEGWTTKTGSKWRTMPELMIQYRAAAFFGRVHCPDLLMGIYTDDEVREFGRDTEKREVVNAFNDYKAVE